MRKFNTTSPKVEKLLQDLLCSCDHESYRHTFYSIGVELASILNERIVDAESVALACASEDADWLAKGIVDNFRSSLDLCVYWSKRHNLGLDSENNLLEFAAIEKSYEEIHQNVDTLIITKSIISSYCVIKSQIMRLTSKYDFNKIYIVSPVMYKDAEVFPNARVEEKMWHRIILVACVMIFFACFAISEFYCDRELPPFLFQTHIKSPNAVAFGLLCYTFVNGSL